MHPLILAVIGAILGAMLDEGPGLVFGAAIGAALAIAIRARERSIAAEKAIESVKLHAQSQAAHLQRELARLQAALREAQVPRPEAQVSAQPQPAPAAKPEPESGSDSEPGSESDLVPIPRAAPQPQPVPVQRPATPVHAPPVAPVAAYESTPDPLEQAGAFVRDLLFGGNTVVRVGILVLLVGVALLLRWAAEHSLFPIELRMAAAGVIGLALVVVGYRLRDARPGFARTLQGGGVAAMYLVVFFSFRAYGLLPGGLAFALLACIAVSSGVLAVLQDAMALIVIGQIGGFMAPVLASTGGGSHVALFSYYLLLNLLILAVAWFKPWRALNLIGFVFTFGIGSTWGALRYQPEQFASTEPFLIAFFLLYTAVPVLFAVRRPDAPRGLVDGTLVFGTPLAALVLQHALVKDMPFAMAYSALSMGALYVGLSRYLYKRAPDALRSLIEAFLAIGIGFATLAVPYGFDNHRLTGATWALEGAGLYWVGVRQRRWLSRLAAVALQFLASIAVLTHVRDWDAVSVGLPLANTRFLAGALLAAAALFIARHAHVHREQLDEVEWRGLQCLIATGLGFWFAVTVPELHAHVSEWAWPGTLIALLGVTAIALELAGRRLAWLPGRVPAALLVLLIGPLLLFWEAGVAEHPFARAGVLGWGACFAAALLVLRRFVPDAPPFARFLHALFLWLCTAFVALETKHLVADFAALNYDWSAAVVGAVIAGAIFATVALSKRASWPFREHGAVYMHVGAGALVLVMLLWTLFTNGKLAGDPAPLPYLPLLNPLDLVQIGGFLAIAAWYRAMQQRAYPGVDREWLQSLRVVLAAAVFIGWNGLLARSVHHLGGVPFDARPLWRSVPLQVAISVSWSLIGVIATVLASKRGRRTLWVAGAVLLGVVVVKLFFIDLARLSPIAKIGTFMVVGLLLVLVGYFAPVPPARDPAEKSDAPDDDTPPEAGSSTQPAGAAEPEPPRAGP